MSYLLRAARSFIDVRREQRLRSLWSHMVRVRHRANVENVYHCCVWKTASQWIRNILSTTSVYRFSGLLPYSYEHHEGRDFRPLQDREFDCPFPPRTIVTPLYINYASFERLPKPESYRAFFVARDPRDLVVSHFFSSKHSHKENQGVLEERALLDGLSEKEGMSLHMTYMADRGIFSALQSWAAGAVRDPRMKLVRFEELVGPKQLDHFAELLEHCDIAVSREELAAILNRLSFQRLSGGRKQGEENKFHKYRSGKSGDWRKYFDQSLEDQFDILAGEVLASFGYA